MRTPWVFSASIAAEALPLIAAVARRIEDPARRWIALGFAGWLVQDGLLAWTAYHDINNHLIIHLGNPINTVLFLLGYAAWADEPVPRRALHIAAVAYVFVWAGIFLTAENARTFSQYTEPLRSLLLILVFAWALVRTVATEPPPVWRSGFYWISIGLLLDFGTGLLLTPISGMLTATAPGLVLLALRVKAGINVVAYLLVTVGMLCRARPSSTGAFSLRPASPS